RNPLPRWLPALSLLVGVDFGRCHNPAPMRTATFGLPVNTFRPVQPEQLPAGATGAAFAGAAGTPAESAVTAVADENSIATGPSAAAGRAGGAPSAAGAARAFEHGGVA